MNDIVDFAEPRVESRFPDIFLATRFLEGRERTVTLGVYGLLAEMRSILDTADDEDLAAARLGWWAQELAQATEGRSQHPVLRALIPTDDTGPAVSELLGEVVTATEMDLERPVYETWQDLRLYLYRSGAAPAMAVTRLLGGTDRNGERVARDAGTLHRFVDLMRGAGPLAATGHVYLPSEALSRAGIEIDRLATGPTPETLQEAVARQADELERRFVDNLAAADDTDALRPARLLAASARHDLQRLHRTGWHVLGPDPVPTAGSLKRLWSLWRAARHARPTSIPHENERKAS